MKAIIFFFPVILLFLLAGCSETETEDVGVNSTYVQNVETPTPPPIEQTDPEKVFQALQAAFAGRLENHGNFTSLREITTSQIYMDYLAAVYKPQRGVKTLEAYFQSTPPDAERYAPYLQEIDVEPTEENIAAIHRITTVHRENAYIRATLQGADEPNLRDVFQELARTLRILNEPIVKDFMEKRKGPIGADIEAKAEDTAFFSDQTFANKTLETDARWLREHIVQHGTDDGLLWAALYNPALIGEILLNFNSTKTFLLWIDLTLSAEE